MSVLRSKRLHICVSDYSEGCCPYDPLFDSAIGDRYSGRMGYGTVGGTGGPEDRKPHDDLAGAY